MTTTPNEPLEYAASSGAPGPEDDDHDVAATEEQTEHADGGYDDRQGSLKDADRDLFDRKDQENSEARYRSEDEPLTEPRKNDE